MMLDPTLSFVPVGTPLSFVGATGATFASDVVDLLGSGAGTAPANIIGNATLFGGDFGIGGKVPQIEALIGTAAATSDSATLTIEFQAAPDTGSGGGYEPGTWVTLVATAALTAAQLVSGQVVARFDFPPAFPANLNPRFIRLLLVTPSGTQFTAGTVAFAGLVLTRDDQANRNAASNYAVH